jgi:RHS repeat-associated protein
MLRAAFLSMTTLTVLIVMSWWDGDHFAIPDAGALGAPTVTVDPGLTPEPTFTPSLPTPTPTDTEVASPTADATLEPATETSTVVTVGTETITPTPSQETPSTTATPAITGTPTLVPEPTPTVDPTLPTVTTEFDPIGATATAVIGTAGGRIASNDGRLVIDFPAGATSEELAITITKETSVERLRPTPDRPFVGLWQFDAASVATQNPVSTFAQDLTVTVRYNPEDLEGFDVRNLAFWNYDALAREWKYVPSGLNWKERLLVVPLNHFSLNAATASPVVDVAPLVDGQHTDLHTGSSTLGIPLDLPPGRGGLTPALNLSYNSNRLGEMRFYTSVSSWVGQGWDLDTPNISIDQNTDFPPDGNHQHRVFLSLGGFSSELMQDYGLNQDPAGAYIWRATNNPFLKIRSDSQSLNNAEWTIWDQSGTKYVFGGGGLTSEYRRYYRIDPCSTASSTVRDYRADVRFIEDVRGNIVNFSYERFMDTPCSGGGTVVKASYPKAIKYNNNNVEIKFNLASGTRDDTPESWSGTFNCGPGTNEFHSYTAPQSVDFKELANVEVFASDGTQLQLVRRYGFDYTTTNNTVYRGASGFDCPPITFAGHHKLDEFNVSDRDGVTYPYTRTKFFYENLAHGYRDGANQNLVFGYQWPYLERVENPIGGKVHFDYAEKSKVSQPHYWSRQAVTQVVEEFGAGQPNVVTDYVYGPGPEFNRYPDPYKRQLSSPQPFEFGAAMLGFNSVTVKDAAGNATEHLFHNDPGTWLEEVRAGREYDTIYRSAAGDTWQRVQTTWLVRGVNNPWLSNARYFTNFISVSETTTTLKQDPVWGAPAVQVVRNSYDGRNYDDASACPFVPPFDVCGFGLLTKVEDLGDTGSGDAVVKKMDYHKNTAKWIFPVRYEERLDADHGDALLGCTHFFYDGAKNTTDVPTWGFLTATSLAVSGTKAQCEAGTAFTSSTNTYSVYDTIGNAIEASVPTDVRPESVSPPPPAQPNHGWRPSSLAFTSSLVDGTHKVYTTKTTNAVGHVTEATSFDLVIGKPNVIKEPNDRTVNVKYDRLGRVTHWYDNLDTDDNPSERYTYGWGTIPNYVKTETRATSGTSFVRTSVTCMDGFGRTFDSLSQFDDANYASVRTDYDARGLEVAVSNPTDVDGTSACEGDPDPIKDRDRTTHSYDVLSNVVTTSAVAAGQYTGPSSHAVRSGRRLTTIDERGNRRDQIRDFTARTLTLKEPASNPPTESLAVTGQSLAGWSAVGGTHTAVVKDNDDATYVHSSTGQAKELFQFDGIYQPNWAITALRLHFRWKQNDGAVPDPGKGMYTIFRQNGIDTRGPIYHRTNNDGWVDETWELPVNPRTGNPWIHEDVDGTTQYGPLIFGFEVVGQTTGTHPYVAEVSLEIVRHSGAQSTTTYESDGNGNLLTVTDDLGNKTSMTYDRLGRKISMDDPDMGLWGYTYAPSGNLKTQTDARLITTTLTYDDLFRLKKKDYSDNTRDVEYFYDSYEDTSVCPTGTYPATTAKGHLTRVYDGAGNDGATPTPHSEFTCFDIRGRVGKSLRYIGSTSYTTEFKDYDALGQPHKIVYPDLEEVVYSAPTQRNFLASMTAGGESVVSSYTRTPWGGADLVTLGNNTITNYDYDYRLRATKKESSRLGATLQDLEYTFDDASNVTAITDEAADPDEHASYTYDQLDRLIGMKLGSQSVAWYKYNSIGNLLQKQEGTTSAVLSYPTSGLNVDRPHAANKVTGNVDLRDLSYDQNGNLTGRSDGLTYKYDAENRLTERSIHGGVMTYTYDAGGGLAMRKDGVSGRTTEYIGGLYEKTTQGSSTTIVKYYSFGGSAVAMRKSGTLLFLLSDHLGSSSMVIEQNGAVVATMKYWPFGGMRSSTGLMPTDKLFTGQQQEPDDVLELYHYNARVYSSLLGRFLSVDPIVGSPGTSQGWNPYSYVMNNPLRYIDPTGMDTTSCFMPGLCGTGNDLVVTTTNAGEVIPHHSNQGACGYQCEMQALANAGVDWNAWALGVLAWYHGVENARMAAWAAATTIADGNAAATAARTIEDSGGGGGGCGRFSLVCDVGSAFSESVDETFESVVDGVGACLESSTCMTVVGGAVVLASPLCGGAAAACALGGGALLTYADGLGCIGGDDVSCGMLVVDAATLGAGGLAVKGSTQVVRVSNRTWTNRMIRRDGVVVSIYAEIGKVGGRIINGAYGFSNSYQGDVVQVFGSHVVQNR